MNLIVQINFIYRLLPKKLSFLKENFSLKITMLESIKKKYIFQKLCISNKFAFDFLSKEEFLKIIFYSFARI